MKVKYLALAVSLALCCQFLGVANAQTGFSLAPGAGYVITDQGVVNGALNFTVSPASTITVSSYQETSCGGSAVTACSSASYNVTSGHRYLVMPSLCGTGCGTGTTAIASSVSGSANLGACSVIPGTQNAASHPIKAEIWTCVATGSGATVVTAHYSASVVWSGVAIVDVAGLAASPDDGVGNTAFGTGTSMSVSLAGAGSTQTNELIIGYGYAGTAGGNSMGAGYTFVSGSNTIFNSLVNSPGVNTATETVPNNGGRQWGMAIAALKHP